MYPIKLQEDTTRTDILSVRHPSETLLLFFFFSPAALDKDAELRQTYYTSYVSSSSTFVIERRSRPRLEKSRCQTEPVSISNSNSKSQLRFFLFGVGRHAHTRTCTHTLMTQNDEPNLQTRY